MQFDTNKYRVYTWKNWLVLHWILNPGLVINEIILGQRIPKIYLEGRYSDKPRLERMFVPCPHCQTIHDGRTWSGINKTAFKNWFGYYCPKCGGIIPCVINVFSFLVLAVTFPIWGWFGKSLKTKWLQKQPKRYENIQVEIPKPTAKTWLKMGIFYGVAMFILMMLVFPLLEGKTIRLSNLFVGLIVWGIGGLVFAYVMKLFLQATGKNRQKNNDIPKR